MNPLACTNVMILASAGTGKTFELSSRYLRLLLEGAHPRSILATTFTRKAAGEILDRIVTRLAAAACDPQTAQATAQELGMPGISQQRFGEIMETLVRNLNNLQVETLDAFFFKIARAFSLDIGMPPGWQMAEDSDVAEIRNRAIRRSLNSRAIVSIVHDLAKGEAKRGISQMLRDTVGDLYEIYRETADQDRQQAWSRLHSLPLMSEPEIEATLSELVALDFKASPSLQKKLEQDFEKIAHRQWNDLLQSGPFSKVADGQTTFSRAPLDPRLLQLLTPLAQHAVATQIELLVKQTQGAQQFLKEFHKQFELLKVEHGIMEFDDVAYLAARLFAHYPFDSLNWRLDQDIDHLLLDEFQDTSVQQWKVLLPLALRVCQPGNEKSFFCVGDVKQAIYGWRGGVAEIFDEVRDEFAASLNDVESRSVSYRSSPAIIDTVNQVFGSISNSAALKDQQGMFQTWQEQFQTHATHRQLLPGLATFEISLQDDEHFPYVAQRIRDISNAHPKRTLGVLLRTNADVARLIFELSRIGVHASEEGGNPLTDSVGVNLLLSALRLLDHPDDPISRFHLLHSPLANLFGLNLDNFQLEKHPIRQLTQEMRYQLLALGYGELLKGWADLLEPLCTNREWFRIGQLIEKAFSISTADHLRTAELVRWIESQKVADPSSARINVMTIHKSKGLEFDIVVLPELEFERGRDPTYIVGRESPTRPIDLVCRYMDQLKRGWLPAEFQQAFDTQTQRSIHELLCTIYVAMTRSKHALHMIARPSSHAGKKNAAGLIMAALRISHHPKTSAQLGQIVWQQTHLDWQAETGAGPEDATPPATHIGSIPFAASQTGRNMPWESPSSREGGATLQLGRLIRQEDNRDARLFGSLIHACFEQVHWLEAGQPDELQLRARLQKVEGADSRTIGRAIAAFRKMLKRPVTAAVLQKAQFSNDLFQSFDDFLVENERPFAVRLDGGMLSGYIDRLVLLGRDGRIVAADIVDFKTDDMTPGDHEALQKRVDVYRPQIQSYRDAVAEIYDLGKEAVSARLMFVAIDQAIPVD